MPETQTSVLRVFYDAIGAIYPALSPRERKRLANQLLLDISKHIAKGYSPAVVKDDENNSLDLVIFSAEIDGGSSQKTEASTEVTIAPGEPSKLAVLQIVIDSRWSVEEMRHFLANLEDMYNFSLTLELMLRLKEEAGIVFRGTDNRGHIGPLTGSPWLIPEQSALQIRRIQYNSPGLMDIAGLGVVIGHLKDFLTKVLEFASTREQRRLENQERALKNQRLQIDNASSLVKLAKEAGCTKSEIKELMLWVAARQDGLITLASKGKIRSVRLLPDKND
jgi:hypothetical protein